VAASTALQNAINCIFAISVFGVREHLTAMPALYIPRLKEWESSVTLLHPVSGQPSLFELLTTIERKTRYWRTPEDFSARLEIDYCTDRDDWSTKTILLDYRPRDCRPKWRVGSNRSIDCSSGWR
jgi:hypothetical protein